MADQLNLTLPDRKPSQRRSSKLILILLICLLIVGSADLIVSVFGPPKLNTTTTDEGFSAESLKNLALKLEKQALRDRSAEVWKEYLFRARTGITEQAKIWYRIGSLYQDDRKYDRALEAYYRSESLGKISELETDINRRIQECLENLGKFAALRYELADRVGMDETKESSGDEVLAEIGTHKITKSWIDRRIENIIERQINSLAAFIPMDQRIKQKEALLKRFSTESERMRLLNQLVLEEILYRKAREDNLAQDPAVWALLRETERAVLAGQVIEKELANHIKITPGDLQTYYEAHIQEYIEPEQVQISRILVKDQETADEVIRKLNDGMSFVDIAKQYSQDAEVGRNEGRPDTWFKRGDIIPGIGQSEDTTRMIFSTEAGSVVKQAIETDKGFQIIKVLNKKQKRQKTFEESRSEVYRALRKRKETEVREALVSRLKEQYNVIIHSSKLRSQPSGESNKDDGDKKSLDNKKTQ